MSKIRIGATARVVVTLAVAGLACGLLSSSAGASLFGKTTLQLSGATKGKLTEGSGGICAVGRSQGVTVSGLVGHLSGADKKYSTWSFIVSSPKGKNGSYTMSPSSGTSGQIGGAVKGAQLVGLQLNMSSGKFTLDGDKGTLNVVFGTGHKAIKVKGAWNCGA
jgi:hypothetical protein